MQKEINHAARRGRGQCSIIPRKGTTMKERYEYEQKDFKLGSSMGEEIQDLFNREGWELMSIQIWVGEPNPGKVFCSYRRNVKLNEYYPQENETSEV